jgi:flagellar biosynthesis protein FlhA
VTDVERKSAESADSPWWTPRPCWSRILSETVRRHCHEILTRQDVQSLLDNLKKTHPAVVNELCPASFPSARCSASCKICWPRAFPSATSPAFWKKWAITRRSRKIPTNFPNTPGARSARNRQAAPDRQRQLRAITMDPKLEHQLAQGVRQSAGETALVIEPRLARHVMDSLSKFIQQMLAAGQQPVVLCAPQLRLAFRRFFENTFNDLAVLSYAEIPPRVQVQNAAVIPLNAWNEPIPYWKPNAR